MDTATGSISEVEKETATAKWFWSSNPKRLEICRCYGVHCTLPGMQKVRPGLRDMRGTAIIYSFTADIGPDGLALMFWYSIAEITKYIIHFTFILQFDHKYGR